MSAAEPLVGSPEAAPGAAVPAAAAAWRGLSLRRRLVLLVLASLVPLLAFILCSQYFAYQEDVAAAGPRIEALARSMALLIDKELEQRAAALEAMATASSAQTGDLATLRPHAERLQHDLFPGATLELLTPDGREILNTALPPGAPTPTRTDLTSLRQVLATGQPSVSHLFHGAVGLQPVVAIDVPVRGADGKIAYVLSLHPQLAVFAEVIRKQQLPNDWIVSVFDQRGVTVARSPNGDRFIGHPAAPSFLASLLAQREGIVESTSLEGLDVLGAFSHSPKFGWAVGIGVPRAELMAPIMAGVARMTALAAAAAAIALLLALYVARGIARPIASLNRLAAAIGGDAPPDLTVTGLPEVDEVGQALRSAEQQRRDSQRAETVLRDGIESIPAGFALYDEQDRLELCNESYRWLFPGGADHIVAGATFEEMLRAAAAAGHSAAEPGGEDDWVAARVAQHFDTEAASAQQLPDGSWALVRNRRLSNGGIAALRTDITSLKAAQQALQTGEERFRSIFDSVSEGIFISAANGQFTMVNAAGHAMYGYASEELVGADIGLISSGVPPYTQADAVARVQGMIASGQPQRFDWHSKAKDGRLFWTEVSVRPAAIGGEPVTLAIVRDITESRAIEEQLRRSEEQLKRAQHLAHIGSTFRDLKTGAGEWSDEAYRIFGVNRDTWLPTAANFLALIHPDDRAMAAATLDPDHPVATPMELRITRADGSTRYIYRENEIVNNAEGSPQYITGTIQDVTERRRIEEELRRAHRMAQMGSWVSQISPETGETIDLTWSAEMFPIFGMDADKFGGKASFAKLIHPEDRERAEQERDDAVAGGQSNFQIEHRIVRPGGSTRWVREYAEIERDAGGRPVRLIGVTQDITERHTVEEQLRQSQKMEAIGNLTGGMAHDFNNLLGVIVGNLGMARDRTGDDELLGELVGEALEAAWHGADLTRRLLAFARRQPLRPARIEPNERITETVRLLRRLLGEDIEVRLNLAAEVWPIVADPAQLEAALTNLAANARDAMPHGGRLILATANKHLDAEYVASHVDAVVGDFAMIEITDTGTGMPPEVMARIFEPFFTTKEPGKGTGLGLSMVFGFLRQSGGHVSVYSEPGVGTTFRLYLPRAPQEEVTVGSKAEPPTERGRGERVLVVEDNAGLRRTVVRQLRDLGYQVAECERAAEAMDILQRQTVDLLLTDIVMPGGLDGVELAQLAHERWPGLRIVLTSGFPQDRVDAGGTSLDGVQLLSKPYTQQELAGVLHDALGG